MRDGVQDSEYLIQDPRPAYYSMVYIILQLKKGYPDHLAHIGVQLETENGLFWIPFCQLGRDNPSTCEYQYKTTLQNITCKDCVKKTRSIGSGQ